MLNVKMGRSRGHGSWDWLDSRHTFSFADYFDRDHMGFRALRVINEDRIAPSSGFGTHPHDNMEIITYVLEGALQHTDSMGNGSVIRPGEVQRMSAGTGVTHSEYNHSDHDPVHLLQIWIVPETQGLAPSYQQKAFAEHERRGALRLIASRDGLQGSVTIHQDVKLYATLLGPGQQVTYQPQPGRYTWIQVARGTLVVNDQTLRAGDAVSTSESDAIVLAGKRAADGHAETEVLVFDLA